ncbi:MAG TPA: iron transporter [Pseudonocardiaceae bacterium]|nr:iron transporter [Pseudonocardiaceae bacterium]
MPWTRTTALAAAVSLSGLVLAGCGSDDGANVRELESGGGAGSGAGSGSAHGGSGSHGGSASAAGGAANVPQGVATQYATLEKEIAERGGETTSGPWRIGYIVEAAEPWFEPGGNGYQFREPAAGETHHIEIIPFEASTGRVVPNVPIRLEIVDAGGQVVDAKDLNFYYSTFFHYANNFSVPQPGQYTLRATLQPPQLMRHGEQADGPALPDGATVEFPNVQLGP